ncbi:MAG: choice-of-anchor B family protein [Gemmatimonadetes bacterium]|nr:choice-of-anchor B family protein [Gemmatimonadota bacterium]MCY3676725.1 choice-of-anchor B family protein [Gemmatimonadota bacterium]MYA40331.1 choice-of-anchor B family protein [Gemmatimonadota bacterium]MYE91814.1 choice-of-anchor B family protein [Gemmatimonadota bacterium]
MSTQEHRPHTTELQRRNDGLEATALPVLLALAACTFLAPAHTRAQTAVDSDRSVPIAAAVTAFSAAVQVEDGNIYVGRPGVLTLFPMPGNRQGGVHVFSRAGGSWAETASVGPDETQSAIGYGEGLDAAGGVMVVGAPNDGTGAVYVYRRTSGEWRLQQRLTWSAAGADDRFGAAVATTGRDIVVGAPGAESGMGVAVVFVGDETGYAEAGTLRPDDAPPGAGFGTAMDLEGGLLAIGAPGGGISMIPGTGAPNLQPGSVHVFGGGDGTWSPAGRLAPPDPGPASLGAGVAVSGDEVFAGAPLSAEFTGTVFQFTRSPEGGGTEWTVANAIRPESPATMSGFGMAVAASGDDIVVGTPLAGGSMGGGFAFRRNAAGAWRQVATFGPGRSFAFYGSAVAIEDDVAVVGAPGADFFEGTGFVFRRTGDGWEAEGTIIDDAAGLDAVLGGERECEDGSAAGFACSEVDLVSFVPTGDLGGERGMIANDLWGWTDPESGREYAIMGRADGTTFVDLSDPGNPVYLGEMLLTEGATANMWRDIKVYENHAYVVADNAGAHGVQVFDLTQLRDVTDPPVTFEATAHYDGINSAHNIVINEETGFAYVVGASGGGETCGGGLHMLDLSDPQDPTFAGCFADASTGGAGTGYSHDAQCVRYNGPDEEYVGREICLGANETALSIADVTDKDATVALSASSYPNTGYLHQGWISDDHRYFYMNDETDEVGGNASRTRTLVWDIQDLNDPILVREHFGTTGASDHNLYVIGDLMYQANYLSGLRILDISDPESPEEIGFFDTVPFGEDNPGFAGAWSVYPYFESGVIIVSSIKEGLFVLRKRPPRVS